MYLIADDIRLGMHAREQEQLVRETVRVTDRAIQLLEEKEYMEVSKGEGGKTVALGSTKKVRGSLTAKLGKRGHKDRGRDAQLGGGLHAGEGRSKEEDTEGKMG